MLCNGIKFRSFASVLFLCFFSNYEAGGVIGDKIRECTLCRSNINVNMVKIEGLGERQR